MDVFICTKPCTYKGRYYYLGEELHAGPQEQVPSICVPKTEALSIKEVQAKGPLSYSEMNREQEIAEAERVYSRTAKDDLIAEAVKLGLSPVTDLAALPKKEIVSLIIKARFHKGMPVAPAPVAPAPVAPAPVAPAPVAPAPVAPAPVAPAPVAPAPVAPAPVAPVAPVAPAPVAPAPLKAPVKPKAPAKAK